MTTKVCSKCGIEKELSAFHKHRACKHGYNTVCKECRKPLSKRQYRTQSVEYRLLHAAKSRSKLKNRECSITEADIVIPEVCPVFGTPFNQNTEYAASLDRIDPTKGYVAGNVQVISLRANMLKNNATANELRKVLSFIEKPHQIKV